MAKRINAASKASLINLLSIAWYGLYWLKIKRNNIEKEINLKVLWQTQKFIIAKVRWRVWNLSALKEKER